uniref:Uncharacterized protein n=1 Tax=Nothobranchius kadleci TaxID=1051664 RepID=A0A1A8CS04_NOTKA
MNRGTSGMNLHSTSKQRGQRSNVAECSSADESNLRRKERLKINESNFLVSGLKLEAVNVFMEAANGSIRIISEKLASSVPKSETETRKQTRKSCGVPTCSPLIRMKANVP